MSSHSSEHLLHTVAWCEFSHISVFLIAWPLGLYFHHQPQWFCGKTSCPEIWWIMGFGASQHRLLRCGDHWEGVRFGEHWQGKPNFLILWVAWEACRWCSIKFIHSLIFISDLKHDPPHIYTCTTIVNLFDIQYSYMSPGQCTFSLGENEDDRENEIWYCY